MNGTKPLPAPSRCPLDTPKGVAATPSCIVRDPIGVGSHCALVCTTDADCGTVAKCASKYDQGICMYPRDRADVASAQLDVIMDNVTANIKGVLSQIDRLNASGIAAREKLGQRLDNASQIVDSLGAIQCGGRGRFTSRGNCACTNGYSGTRCHISAQVTAALLVFKASGGAANDKPLASWNGTDPCGGAWAGVTCSGGTAPAVTGLVLDGYVNSAYTTVAGDVGTLSPLVQLTVIRLSNTKVAGDVKGFAPLVRLTVLVLEGTTKVAGRAGALAPLTRLTYIQLQGTAVAGCDAFCATGGPFHAHCDPTHGERGCQNKYPVSGCWCP